LSDTLCAGTYFDLVFDIPSTQVFSYRQDEKGEAATGKRAMVPFGRRELLGYITGSRDSLPAGIGEGSVKQIRRVVDGEPVFDNQDLELARWVGGYYFCGLGQALSAMIPSGKRAGAYPSLTGAEDITETALELSGEQRDALEAITAPSSPASGLFYLYGITGSGKTEVFLRAAESALNE
jgi:primosomal protein N' (replication factor Y)